MKKAKIIAALVVVSVFSSLSNIYSQDWPQWMGINRDARVPGFKAPASWPAELRQEWKINVGTGDATPVLVGNKLYLNTRQGSEEVVLCLEATSGKELWRSSYPCMAVTGPSGSHPGPRSTPAVSNGKVFTLGVSAILSCMDANTGKVLWRRQNNGNIVPQFFTGMSPLVVDNTCIVHTGTTGKGEVIALDVNTGKEKWIWTGDGPSYASPALITIDNQKQLVVQTEKNLIGLSLTDGKLLWQFATPAQQRFYNSSSPCIDGQTVYITGQGSGLKALKIEKSGNEFVAKELWANPSVGAKWNTPVLKDGFLYGFTDLKRAYCVNAATGVTAWVDNAVLSDFSTLIDCGSVLIGLPSTGSVHVIKPDATSYNEIARYKVADTPVYSFPVISGNGIYVKDAEFIALYRLN